MQQKMSKECFETLNQNCLLQYGADNSIKWIIPTQDRYGSKGCPKTLIKYIKRAIKIVIGEQTLSFLELQTVRLYIETCFRKEHMSGMQVAPNKANTLSPSTCYKVILFLPFVWSWLDTF